MLADSKGERGTGLRQEVRRGGEGEAGRLLRSADHCRACPALCALVHTRPSMHRPVHTHCRVHTPMNTHSGMRALMLIHSGTCAHMHTHLSMHTPMHTHPSMRCTHAHPSCTPILHSHPALPSYTPILHSHPAHPSCTPRSCMQALCVSAAAMCQPMHEATRAHTCSGCSR